MSDRMGRSEALPPPGEAVISEGRQPKDGGAPQDAPTGDQPRSSEHFQQHLDAVHARWDAEDAAPMSKSDVGDLPAAGGPVELREADVQLWNAVGEGVADVMPARRWEEAAPKARAAMLQEAHAYVAGELGLGLVEPLVFSDAMEPDVDFGAFDPASGEITVGSWLLEQDDPVPAAVTIAHENRHGFQQHVIDGDLAHPDEAAWAQADAAYQGIVDFEDYMANPLESDAFAIEAPFIAGYQREGMDR